MAVYIFFNCTKTFRRSGISCIFHQCLHHSNSDVSLFYRSCYGTRKKMFMVTTCGILGIFGARISSWFHHWAPSRWCFVQCELIYCIICHIGVDMVLFSSRWEDINCHSWRLVEHSWCLFLCYIY